MDRFHRIQDAAAIITVGNGVFKQVDIYHRGSGLYIAAGGGYVRLYTGHRSGHPKIRWDDIEVPGINGAPDMHSDAHGKLSVTPNHMKLIEAAVTK
jgi:hypothetical protein